LLIQYVTTDVYLN